MLTAIYRENLIALIEIYEKTKTAVRGEEIAKVLNKTPGTIRNQMQTLRALGYVEGIPGPKGGYKPTILAYNELHMKKAQYLVEVPIYQDNEKVEGINVQQITFTDINNPQECKSIITVIGDTTKIREFANLKIGPTPINKIILIGKVIGRDDTERKILLDTKTIVSIPKQKVSELISFQHLITFPFNMSIKECEKILIEKNIESAPVINPNGTLLGILSLREIVNAHIGNKENLTAGECANKDVISISENAQISDCVVLMKKNKVKRLVVIDPITKIPKGIVSMTDIINLMVD
ncbi:MAG: CBS domain-containing protein [Candidatus Altarchaeaceae archaeon]